MSEGQMIPDSKSHVTSIDEWRHDVTKGILLRTSKYKNGILLIRESHILSMNDSFQMAWSPIWMGLYQSHLMMTKQAHNNQPTLNYKANQTLNYRLWSPYGKHRARC